MQPEQELWQQELRECIRSVDQLLDFLKLNHTQLNSEPGANYAFPLRVPLPFAKKMEQGNPNDPLLQQVLPRHDELLTAPGYSRDPLQEQQANKIPGLLHKYFGRVLLIVTGSCAIHCRYCFRQHFPYQENAVNKTQLDQIIAYLQQHPDIYEVILSGGDPLMLKDHILSSLLTRLADMRQLKYLRIHTRLPVVLPSRITDQLIRVLAQTRLQKTMVLHCNHPQEIDSALIAAIQKMRSNQITVLNQSVLLKHVNDNADTLIALSHRLYQAGALPYYLHIPDATEGTQHFAVSEAEALVLMKSLQARLSGFLVPKLVKETPGAASKTAIITA